MAQLPSGPQTSSIYKLVGPDGAVAVFNDQTDPNYVGVLEDITGFDSPEVRENADDLVQMDGGIHGDFFYGRRPITMSGKIDNIATATERNQRSARLQQATNAMRGDAYLYWTPEGSIEQRIALRRQQPLRITGAWIKDFQVSMVAADPRIYSSDLHTSNVAVSSTGGSGGFAFPMSFPLSFGAAVITGQVFVENQGNATSYPVITVQGPGTNPSIYNATTGDTIAMIYTLAAGEILVIDTLNRSVLLGGTTPKYSAIDFPNNRWWGLVPGLNDLRLLYFSSSSGAQMTVNWRDAWI